MHHRWVALAAVMVPARGAQYRGVAPDDERYEVAAGGRFSCDGGERAVAAGLINVSVLSVSKVEDVTGRVLRLRGRV